MNLTDDEIQRIVTDKKSQFSSWNKDSIQSFISIWETRLKMAIDYHKDPRFESLPREILAFVKPRNPKKIRLYVGGPENQSFGFLYDTDSKEFLQMIGEDQSQHDTVPKPSGPSGVLTGKRPNIFANLFKLPIMMRSLSKTDRVQRHSQKRRVFSYGLISLISLLALGALICWVGKPRTIPLTNDQKAELIHEMLVLMTKENSAFIYSNGVPPHNTYSEIFLASDIKSKKTVYFENKTSVPDSVFMDFGFKPLPAGWNYNYDSGNVALFYASDKAEDIYDKNAISIAYIFGDLGAYYFEIHVYKIISKTKVFYIFAGVS